MRVFRFFSAVTVLGTPQDITLQELRIECFFPLEEATAAEARNLEEQSDVVDVYRHRASSRR